MREITVRFRLISAFGSDATAEFTKSVEPETVEAIAAGCLEVVYEVFAEELEGAFYLEEDDALEFLGMEV